MTRYTILLMVLFISVPLFASKGKQVDRLEESAIVLEEIMNIPEGGIPTDLLRPITTGALQ